LLEADRVEHLFVQEFAMSSEEFQRQLEVEFAQASPEEQAEFSRLVDEANAVLPGMLARVDRMSAHVDTLKTSVGEMRESFATLEERLSAFEDSLADCASKPLPVREGVGVGTVRGNRASDRPTIPTPRPSPEGKGGK
jgi:hypothetical protein